MSFSDQILAVQFLTSLPVHDTFAKALSASESRNAVARCDVEILGGETVVVCSFRGHVLSIAISNGRILTIVDLSRRG